MKRKLTTVFCADAQNYGRLMARNERDTLERLNRYRSIMESHFASHEGRMVNTWGDAIIAEFTSVVEAVRCAVEIQDAIGAENRSLPDSDQMWFRIGINLGDVMSEGDDIYGDGVNVASRLEAIAEPGGVMVSPSVYEFAHKQLAVGFDFAGTRQVKDGEDPITAYRVRIGGSNAPPPEAETFQQFAATPKVKPEHEGPTAWEKMQVWYERFRGWFDVQDRKVRFSVMMIGFFFAINLFFSGIATPWFIFPSAPFLFHILLRRRKSDGKKANSR
ncbi:MAG: adenylate/guanylate cyclase domain-containing protein [Salaquimonas sp.]|nr:adenylate/guanylate cyclase domain-containing protein [Salaquimonas sp.]